MSRHERRKAQARQHVRGGPHMSAPDATAGPVDFALYFADLGFKVIPLPPRSKKPVLTDWPNKGTTDPAKIAAWYFIFPSSSRRRLRS